MPPKDQFTLSPDTIPAVKHEPDLESADRPSEPQFVPGVDLDGVCVDFYGKLREIAAD